MKTKTQAAAAVMFTLLTAAACGQWSANVLPLAKLADGSSSTDGGSETDARTDGGQDMDTGIGDAGFTDRGNPIDSGFPEDAMAHLDAATPDTGPDGGFEPDARADAGFAPDAQADSGVREDAGLWPDAALPDTGPRDTGVHPDAQPNPDTGADAGFADATTPDATPPDTGPPPHDGGFPPDADPLDTGPPPLDAGFADSGTMDAGFADAGSSPDAGDAGVPCTQRSLDEDFESTSTGMLNGQNGWVGNAQFGVQDTDAQQGIRSATYPTRVASNDFITHAITPASTGYLSWWMMANQDNAIGGVQLQSNLSTNEGNLTFRPTNREVGFYDNSSWVVVGHYMPGTWHFFEVEWRSSNRGEFHFRIDGLPVDWTPWMRSVNQDWATINSIALNSNGRGASPGTFAWDNFVSGCTTP